MSNANEKAALVARELESIVNAADAFIEDIESTLLSDAQELISPEAREEFGLDGKVMSRRFSVAEVLELLGISRQTLYNAEEDGRLPQPDMKFTTNNRKVRAGYTLEQLCHMREVFNRGPKGLKGTRTLGFLNQKGGSWKSTSSLNFAQFLVIQGYKVLLVDTDPQGSLSTMMGFKPDLDVDYSDTLTPFLMQDEEWAQQEGRDISVLDTLEYAVQGTYWTNIDIIPASSQLLKTDLMRASSSAAHTLFSRRTGKHIANAPGLLRAGLDSIAFAYDVIIIDGTPSLNLSTLNVVSACDEIIVPTPAQMLDFASTVGFLSLIQEVFEKYATDGMDVNVPDFRFLITKYAASDATMLMEEAIRQLFGKRVFKTPVKASEEARRANNSMRTVYEVSPSETTNSRGLKAAVANYNEAFQEVVDRVLLTKVAIDDPLEGAVQRMIKRTQEA